MGVPGFYRYIKKRYPIIYKPLDDPCRPLIHNFYIDFNQVIFSCAQVFPNLLNAYPRKKIITAAINNMCRYLDQLVQIIQPQSLLFLAIDGTPPYAKAISLRRKRYMKSFNNTINAPSYGQLVAGSEFFDRIHSELKNFIREKTEKDITWQKFQVVYSSYHTPGEGEHKLIDFILKKDIHEKKRSNVYSCVYSNDADLIFLLMNYNCRHFSILRNVDQEANDVILPSHFEVLYLDLFKECLSIEYNVDPTNFSLSRLFADFLAISFLLGNDFLPRFPDIKEDYPFETLFKFFRDEFYQKKKFLVHFENSNAVFINNNLESFLYQFSHNFQKDGFNSQKYMMDNFSDEMNEDDDFEKKICLMVLDAFDWVLGYYITGIPQFDWYYPYAKIPPMSIVAKYIQDHKSIFNKSNSALTPYEFLICTASPKAHSLFNNEIQQNIINHPSLSVFFPQDIESNQDRNLPPIDIEILRPILKNILENSNLGDKVLKRNKIKGLYLIENGQISMFNFTQLRLIPEEETPAIDLPVLNCGFPCLAKMSSKTESNGKKITVLTISFDYDKKVLNKSKKIKNPEILIGHTFFVDFPYWKPCLVIGIEKNEVKINESVNYYKKCGFTGISSNDLFLSSKLLFYANSSRNIYNWSQKTYTMPYILTAPIQGDYFNNCSVLFPEPKLELPKVDDKVVINDGSVHSGLFGKVMEISGDQAQVYVYSLPVIEPFILTYPPSYDDAMKVDIMLEEKLKESISSSNRTITKKLSDLVSPTQPKTTQNKNIVPGTRVTCTASCGPIPFGATGTIMKSNPKIDRYYYFYSDLPYKLGIYASSDNQITSPRIFSILENDFVILNYKG